MKIRLSNNIKKFLASGTLILTTLSSSSCTKNIDEYLSDIPIIEETVDENIESIDNNKITEETETTENIGLTDREYELTSNNYETVKEITRMLMSYSNDFDNCDIVDIQINGKKYEHVHLCFVPSFDKNGNLIIRYVNVTHSAMKKDTNPIYYYNAGKYYIPKREPVEGYHFVWEEQEYEPTIIDEITFKETLSNNYSVLMEIRNLIIKDDMNLNLLHFDKNGNLIAITANGSNCKIERMTRTLKGTEKVLKI